jgi:prepilin-type N-terminal cleavage/methylation domain-containing protein/prepilin-type processing-associated H-X9-DG protein
MMPARRGFTLVELMVVIVIIALLMAMLLPGVQAAREAARNARCQNNLKQLGLACLNYERSHGGLPPASIFPQYITSNPSINVTTLGDQVRIGWLWLILPYLEQSNLADQYHFDVPWFDPSLQTLINGRLSVMECPTDPVAGHTIPNCQITDPVSGQTVSFTAAACDYFVTVALNSNVVGVFNARQDETYTSANNTLYNFQGALQDDKATNISEIRDGTSNTMMVAEMSGREKAYVTGGILDVKNTNHTWQTYGYGAWAHNNKHVVTTYTFDAQSSPGPCAINCSNQYAIYSFHPHGANALFADGSVHFLSQEIDMTIFCDLVARADGDVIAGSSY